jgi:hypothetical protein
MSQQVQIPLRPRCPRTSQARPWRPHIAAVAAQLKESIEMHRQLQLHWEGQEAEGVALEPLPISLRSNRKARVSKEGASCCWLCMHCK